jgi:hypothetical protein
MRLLPRARTLLARHPVVWWAVVVALGVISGVSTAGALGRVDAARRSWGAGRAVWVASAAVAPGDPLVAERHVYPVAVVPASAVTSSPAGSAARERVAAGEVIVAADVDATGLAGLIPPGSVAIAVATASPQLHPGDGVAVFANGVRLADGMVVAVSSEQVVVAVPASAAAELAVAVPTNAVVLALLPPG